MIIVLTHRYQNKTNQLQIDFMSVTKNLLSLLRGIRDFDPTEPAWLIPRIITIIGCVKRSKREEKTEWNDE